MDILEGALVEHRGARDELGLLLEAEAVSCCMKIPGRWTEVSGRLRALDVDALEGAPAALVAALAGYHEMARAGDRERAVALAHHAHRMDLGGSEESALSYGAATYTLLFADRLEEASREVDAWAESNRAHAGPYLFANTMAWRAMLHYAYGAVAEAEADSHSAVAALPHLHVLITPQMKATLALILVERDAVEEAARMLGDAEAASSTTTRSTDTTLHVARAVVAAARADHAGALAHATALGRLLEERGRINPAAVYPAWRTLAARAHHATGATT